MDMVLYNKKSTKKTCRIDYIDGHFKENDFDKYIKNWPLSVILIMPIGTSGIVVGFFVEFGSM